MSYTSPAQNIASSMTGDRNATHTLVFLDVETTDTGAAGEIIQLCYLLDGAQKGLFNEYYKPRRGMRYAAMGINRITPEMVEDKEPFGVVPNNIAATRLAALNTPDNVLVAHNARFDEGMLRRSGIEVEMRIVDTLRVAKHLVRDAESYALSSLFFQLGLYRDMGKWEKRFNQDFGVSLKRLGAHNALYDVVMLKMLYDYLSGIEESIDRLVELSQKPAFDDRPLKFGRYKGMRPSEVIEADASYAEWAAYNLDNEDLRYTFAALLKQKRNEEHE